MLSDFVEMEPHGEDRRLLFQEGMSMEVNVSNSTLQPALLKHEGPKQEEDPAIAIDEVSNFINSQNMVSRQYLQTDQYGRTYWPPTTDGAPPPIPRMVSRSLPFSQSLNEVAVHHHLGLNIFMLLRHDMFHVILRRSTATSLLILLSLWTISLLLFALCYVGVDMDPYEDCGLGKVGSPIKYGAAFAFSLETCTTVGYGLPGGTNAFFDNCPMLQVVLYFQMLFSMMFNAFLIAFFFARIARCDKRGAQVLLSNKANMTVVNGQVRFQVRVYDVDAANPVVEARIRMYAVMKARPVPRQLRILRPNDEIGAVLFTSFPSVVTHHVDIYSLLHPPVETPINPSGITLRQADSVTGNRREFVCPICGESYGAFERLCGHIKFMSKIERKEGYPIRGTHQSLSESDYAPSKPKRFEAIKDLNILKGYYEREISEVICVVEGIEPSSSGTFAALQSYMFEDVVFQEGVRFKPCVETVKGEKGIDDFVRVDLDLFHEIEDREGGDAADRTED